MRCTAGELPLISGGNNGVIVNPLGGISLQEDILKEKFHVQNFSFKQGYIR